jgi:hypothetical protein
VIKISIGMHFMDRMIDIQFTYIFDSLNLSDKDLITSHVAARLNGYLGGYSTIEAFEEVL